MPSLPTQNPGVVVKDYLKTLRLELDEQYFIDRMILADGYWELNVTLYVHKWVEPGFTCVDVGSNAGYATLFMAQRAGESGKVFAFEPNPRMREKFLRNLALNPENLAPIELLPFALGADEGSYRLHEDLGFGFGNAAISKVQSGVQGDVQTRTLDSFSLPRLDFLKIDVEGMELQVLQGAVKTIEEQRPIVLFETLTSANPEEHKPCEDFLRAQGYICYNIDMEGGRLVEVRYPHYPQEDILAIPVEKVESLR